MQFLHRNHIEQIRWIKVGFSIVWSMTKIEKDEQKYIELKLT